MTMDAAGHRCAWRLLTSRALLSWMVRPTWTCTRNARTDGLYGSLPGGVGSCDFAEATADRRSLGGGWSDRPLISPTREVDQQCLEPQGDVDRSDLAVSVSVSEWYRG